MVARILASAKSITSQSNAEAAIARARSGVFEATQEVLVQLDGLGIAGGCMQGLLCSFLRNVEHLS